MKATALCNPIVPKFEPIRLEIVLESQEEVDDLRARAMGNVSQPIMHQIAEALKPHMTEPGMQHFFSLVMGK